MYFIAVPLKEKKPNTGLLRNKVVLINSKTKEVMSFQLGMATDWAYYEARGWTHWIKMIPKNDLLDFVKNVSIGQQGELKSDFVARITKKAKQLLHQLNQPK